MKRLNYLKDVFTYFENISKHVKDINDLKEMACEMKTNKSDENDDEMKALIQKDYHELNTKLVQLKIEMVDMLIPDELEDIENAILELNAGVGGAESRLFLTDLFEMYRNFTLKQGWDFRIIKIDSESNEEIRTAQIEISGANAFKYFKFESGVHRVQRVPKTETTGRIHTSTVGVVVYPKPNEINIKMILNS